MVALFEPKPHVRSLKKNLSEISGITPLLPSVSTLDIFYLLFTFSCAFNRPIEDAVTSIGNQGWRTKDLS